MPRNTTHWMVDELGLALLNERPAGEIRANAAARERLGAAPLPSLEAAVARLVELSEDDAALTSLVRRGRAGQRCSDHLGASGTPVMCLPGERGLEVVVDVRPRVTEEVLERAAAADLSAVASHEVANALGAILGWAQLGLQGPPMASPQEALHQIEESARMTRDAVREILVTMKGGTVATQTTEVRSVALGVASLLEPEARRRDLTIHTDDLEECTAAASRAQLFTIFWNLAHNATQVLPSGGNVWLRARSRGGQVRLEVRDDGPGMSPETAARAFDSYFSTRVEGTGLGLSLVKRTVEAAGGKVTLKTVPDRGTTFQIVLPQSRPSFVRSLAERKDADSPRRPRSRRTPASSEAAHKISGVIERPIPIGTRILVVEDNGPLRDLVRTTLELRGAEVSGAASADEAARMEGPFDLALVDVSLPDGRGDQVVADLRARGVVRIAGLMSGGDLPPELVAGGTPDGWIRKPFEPDELVAAVRRLNAVARSEGNSSVG